MSKTKLLMIRDGGCLRPYGDVAWEAFDNIRSKKPVMVTIHQARNPEHHNKFWALATAVANFCKDFDDAEDAVQWAKVQIPEMRKEYVLNDGRLAIRTKSIAFESMDQIEFAKFYERALWLWAERIGTDPDSLLKEFADTLNNDQFGFGAP